VEALDSTGTFGLAGSEKLGVYGRLVFDPGLRDHPHPGRWPVQLLPNGELHEAWGGERDRIFGTVDRDGHDVKVTLIDCIWLSPTRYHANRLLPSGHLAADDTTFEQAIVRLRDLPAWVAQEAMTVEVDTALDETERRELRVHLDRPPTARAPFARGDLMISVGRGTTWTTSNSPFGSGSSSSWRMRCRRP
jgi:hypothetical protein